MRSMVIALLACGALASTAGAQAKDRESVSLKINTAGVDFDNAASVASFRRNLSQQIAAKCNPGDRLNADLAPDFQCRTEMAASAEQSIRIQIARAAQDRLARAN